MTGAGLKPLSDAVKQDMVTVFIPSSPTAFSGYVVVVPRDSVVELPLKVEEAMRLLVSGGVVGSTPTPGAPPTLPMPAPRPLPPPAGAVPAAPPAPAAAFGRESAV